MLNRRRMMMKAPSSAEEAWSYAWDYTMGVPDTALWDYPIGSGSVSLAGDEGLFCSSKPIANYAGLRFKNHAALFGRKAVYEVEVKVTATSLNGFRIVLTSGSNGVSDGHGLQVTINENYLNVLTRGKELSTVTQTAPVTYGEWHKVRLELDTPANSNKVYLDGALIATVANADLSNRYATNVWWLIHPGNCYVRSVRYRKED